MNLKFVSPFFLSPQNNKKAFVIFLVVVLFHFNLPIYAQAPSQLVGDTLVANQFYLEAAKLAKSKKYDSAIYNFQQASILYKEASAWDRHFYNESMVGYQLNVQRKYAESLLYMDSIERNSTIKLNLQLSSYEKFYGVLSWSHFKLLNYKEALAYFDLLTEKAKNEPTMSIKDILYANYYKGVVYQRIGQYDLGLKQMRASEALCQNDSSCSFLGTIYNNLGIIFRNLGEYNRSVEYYNTALSILKKNTKEVSLTPIYNNIGTVYLHLDEPQKTLTSINYALNVLTSYTSDYYQVESALINTKANALIALGNYDSAQLILETVLAREIDKYGETGSNSSVTLFTLGKVYASKEMFDTSNMYFEQSIRITQQFLGTKNDKSAEIFTQVGLNQIKSEAYIKAIASFQQGIISLVTDFNEIDFEKNPTLNSTILDRVELVESLYQKTEALYLLYLKTSEIKYLKSASKTNNKSTLLAEQIRNNMLYESSKIKLSKKVKLLYEQSIYLALALDIAFNEPKEEKIFNAMENSKSYLLAKEVLRAKSMGYSSQSNAAIAQETKFKTGIKLLETKLLSATRNKKDSSSITLLNSELFELKESFELYQQSEPEKSNLANDIGVPSIKQVQESLSTQDLMISYFAGTNTLFAIAITKDDAQFYELGSYKEVINDFLNILIQSHTSNAKDFQLASNKTFKLILGPILSNFNKAERLIIIPDKQLGYIPFDALATSELQSPSFTKIPYLLNKYTILQHQSGGLYIEKNQTNNKSDNGFIGFAPNFSNDQLIKVDSRTLRSDLQPLPFAQKEVEVISKLLGGNVEIGTRANEDYFKLVSSDYNILHIASHAMVDEEKPLYSKLVFASEDSLHQEDGNLYSFEIYGMNLNCDLVTLSACNTGSGKYFDGEGIFSLGRAFLLAGANSVLTSLWQVPDQSTSVIMESFYRNLKNGENKPEALRQAKLSYLKNTDALTANPYYWAGFVYIGKPEAVYNNYKVYYWLVGLLLLLTGYFVFGRNSSPTKLE